MRERERERKRACARPCQLARKRIEYINVQEFKSKMNRTSAEPARTTAYSPDIGWRVVWQRLGMDLTFKQIAQRLQIAVGTAHRIFKRFMDTGDVSAIARKGVSRYNLRKLDQYHEVYLLCMISENPGLFLSEICQKFKILPMLQYQDLQYAGYYIGMVVQGKKSFKWLSSDV